MDFSSLANALQTTDGTLHLTRDACRASVFIYEGACLVQVADSPFAKRGEPIATWGVEACVVAPEMISPFQVLILLIFICLT